MALRTPRRRISPRAKRRCQAIKGFIRRALGNQSQPSIKIGSSIAVNVTNKKRKPTSVEEQLEEESSVDEEQSQQCTDDSSSVSGSSFEDENNVEEGINFEQTRESSSSECLENTKESSIVSDYTLKNIKNDNSLKNGDTKTKKYLKKIKHNNYKSAIHNYEPNHRNQNTRLIKKHRSIYSSNSLRSIDRHFDQHQVKLLKGNKEKKQTHQTSEYTALYEPVDKFIKNKKKRQEETRMPNTSSNSNPPIDQDFIADLIRKQYKPIKMFGRKESCLSQMSVPICCDIISPRGKFHNDICSCGYESGNKCDCNFDLRSLCDTRLYGSKKNIKPKKPYKKQMDKYNDSELYDVVPVKEKSSPLAKRKFVDYKDVIYKNYNQEIPTSPRNQRLKLNLSANNCTDLYEQYMQTKQPYKKITPSRNKRYLKPSKPIVSDISSEVFVHNRNYRDRQKLPYKERDNNFLSQDYIYRNTTKDVVTVNEVVLNKTQETDFISDKTDKALIEIKDILQNFLHEIKKESFSQSEVEGKITNEQETNSSSQYINQSPNCKDADKMLNSATCTSNIHASLPSFMPACTNPYCYPVLPMYPPNMMTSGFLPPNATYSFTGCPPKNEDITLDKSTKTNGTDDLIREMYKLFTENSEAVQRKSCPVAENTQDNKDLISKCVGGSTAIFANDAKVGTPKMKSFSKSCEAISPRDKGDQYCSASLSYSESVLDKLSLEVTATQSESDCSIETAIEVKPQTNRFAKILKSIGLIKKKKKDVIKEMSECTLEIDMRHQRHHHRERTNYMTRDHDMYNARHHYDPYYSGSSEVPGRPPMDYGSDPYMYEPNQSPYMHYRNHNPYEAHLGSGYHATPGRHYPDYISPNHPYPPMQSQVPLCLKEVEVKSIATQSDKQTWLQKLAKKIPASQKKPDNNEEEAFMTSKNNDNSKAFNWMKLKSKIDPEGELDAVKKSLKTSKNMTADDDKMRKAVINKLMNKRNPFSTRNMIVKSMLGKENNAFKAPPPPQFIKPKLFF